MKKKILLSVLVLLIAFCAIACGKRVPKEGLWKDATYTTDKEFGKGAKTLYFEVKAENQSVTFTIHSDKETVGEALVDNKLVAGEQSAFGLYVKVVNGMTADWDVDQSYWAFYKDGAFSLTGVDTTKFADGDHYEFVYSK